MGAITGSMVQRFRENWIGKAEMSELSGYRVSRVGVFFISFSFCKEPRTHQNVLATDNPKNLQEIVLHSQQYSTSPSHIHPNLVFTSIPLSLF